MELVKMINQIYSVYFRRMMLKNSEVRSQVCCPFCQSPSEEIRLILKGVLLRLLRMLKRHKSLQGQCEKAEGSLQRIIRVLFDRHQFELKLSQGCSHEVLRNLFRERLNCRQQLLQTLLQQLCDQLARRNYELQIVVAQIKNVQQSVVDLQQKLQGQSQKRQSTGLAEVKVEECEPSERKPIQEVSPPTGSNYACLPGIPYPYNILYYGNGYYCE